LTIPNAKTRVSKYFTLDRDQTTLDFVDVPIGNDVAVFLDPSRLRSMESKWASECNSLLQHFFEALLVHIRNNKKSAGIYMLEGLTEKNEFHLGFSKGKSKGSGFGPEYAKKFWDALSKSKAGRTGLLKDIEDACLFIEGVGPDRISDATCNIIRGPLIRYTQHMCLYYNIPMKQNVESGPVWNTETQKWEDSLIELPVSPYGKLLFVPKIIVRHRLVYDVQNYYTHYLLPEMQAHEKSTNSGLVHTLKDGRTRVTKKALRETYGADKLSIAEQSIKHPNILEKYRNDSIRTSRPLSHFQFAEIENIDLPRFDKLLENVISLPVGITNAVKYENAVEALLSALFFPSLTSPQKQDKQHEGRKRVDITYVNTAQTGFFSWLASHYPSAHIFVECKNYGSEISNPELDQLSGRFGPSKGVVGILVCRSIKDPVKLAKSCADTARDDRGYILTITDLELSKIVKEYTSSNGESEYPLLRTKFKKLVM
jgi:hypothetical protein